MSFQQGLSGLNAASKQLDVIGNNIANGSTVGFKSSRAEFGDLYASTVASTSGTQAGIGVQTVAVSQQFQQGNITGTSNPLDMAISGNGFFRLTSENNGNGIEAFSRNGQFKLDKDGYIVNNGYYLNGYQFDKNGVKSGAEQPLQISTLGSGIAKATDAITWKFNLDGGAKTIDLATLTNAFNPADAKTYSYTTGSKFYDNLGNTHTVSLYFARRPTDPVTGNNQWDVYRAIDGVITPNPATGTFPTDPADVTTLLFDGSGALQTAIPKITIAAETNVAKAYAAFDIDLSNTTQFTGDYSVASLKVGGYPAGKFSGVSADASGTIYAKYTNGISNPIGQLNLYNFANPQGLAPVGDNRWTYTTTAGEKSMANPNAGGMGALKSSALEDSNADTTAELVNMIVAQRFYQANAQTIKTQDTIMQTLLNLR